MSDYVKERRKPQSIPDEPSTDAWYTLVNEWLASNPSIDDEYLSELDRNQETLCNKRAKRRT